MQKAFFIYGVPNDESSEEFLILGIRDFQAELELEDVAGGINTALNSVRDRGGRLNDDSARVCKLAFTVYHPLSRHFWPKKVSRVSDKWRFNEDNI